MTIGIDGRCLQNGKNTGVEEYARSLILRLVKENHRDQFVVFVNSFSDIKERFEWLDEFDNVCIKRFNVPNKILNFCFWLLNWPKIDKMIGGADYFISPNVHFAALSEKCQQILTVHDLSFERMPETFSWKRRLWHFLINPRRSVRRAVKIWAVSESTSQDLVNLYRVNPEKIEINYPFFDFESFDQTSYSKQELRDKFGLSGRFILFLGTIEPRKNIKSLIIGFESFKRRNKGSEDFKLVIAGEKGWLWESIIERAKQSPFHEDIIFTSFVEERDKPLLYSLADVFVYPSFYEGFGFPPLEAMASGTPTITSNQSSMPEVLSDGALLINPYKPFEICLALENLLKDREVYRGYIEKGKNRSREIANKKRVFNIY